MAIETFNYGGLVIPIMESKSANPFYNLPQDEIDKLRCGTLFDGDGNCVRGGYQGTAFEDRFKILDDAEIRDRVEFMMGEKSSIAHLMVDADVPCKDQNGHGLCWMYGCVSAVEGNRLVQGLEYVQLNPHTAASARTGGRDRGGFSDEGFEYLSEHGCVPASIYAGRNMRESLRIWDDAQAVAEAAKYKVLEWVVLKSGDMAALRSTLASNVASAIGLMWWRHMVVFIGLAYHAKLGWLYLMRNSHGAKFANNGFCFLTESVAKHGGGAVAFVSA